MLCATTLPIIRNANAYKMQLKLGFSVTGKNALMLHFSDRKSKEMDTHELNEHVARENLQNTDIVVIFR